MDDHSLVRIIHRIVAQGLQFALRRGFRRRHTLHDGFQNLLDADSFLGAAREGFFAGDGEDLFDLHDGAIHIGVW